jgi:hypothetical protein
MRETSFLCQQLPWPTFAREGACVFAHQSDITQMDQSGIKGDVNHDLEKGLMGKIATEAGVVVPHEPSRVEVVPNQTVASSVAFGRSIHKEMDFVQWNHPQKIAGS